MGSNGKVIDPQVALGLPPLTRGAEALVNSAAKKGGNRIALALVPFTPVPFSGDDLWLAVGRIALYGALAYFTYNKMRPASYIFMGAAGVSATTSLLGGAWGKK